MDHQEARGIIAAHIAAILTNLTAAERVDLANCQHPGRLAKLKCHSRGCHKTIDSSNDTYCWEHYRATLKRAELVEAV